MTTQAAAYVYLAPSEDRQRFKIGWARQPRLRLAQLPHATISQGVRLVGCPSDHIARRIEKTLHFLFEGHRVELERADGHTEWFAIECFAEVVALLEREQLRLQHLGLTILLLSPDDAVESHGASTRPPSKDLELRHKKRKRARGESLADVIEAHRTAGALFDDWLLALKDQGAEIRRFTAKCGALYLWIAACQPKQPVNWLSPPNVQLTLWKNNSTQYGL